MCVCVCVCLCVSVCVCIHTYIRSCIHFKENTVHQNMVKCLVKTLHLINFNSHLSVNLIINQSSIFTVYIKVLMANL